MPLLTQQQISLLCKNSSEVILKWNEFYNQIKELSTEEKILSLANKLNDLIKKMKFLSNTNSPNYSNDMKIFRKILLANIINYQIINIKNTEDENLSDEANSIILQANNLHQIVYEAIESVNKLSSLSDKYFKTIIILLLALAIIIYTSPNSAKTYITMGVALLIHKSISNSVDQARLTYIKSLSTLHSMFLDHYRIVDILQLIEGKKSIPNLIIPLEELKENAFKKISRLEDNLQCEGKENCGICHENAFPISVESAKKPVFTLITYTNKKDPKKLSALSGPYHQDCLTTWETNKLTDPKSNLSTLQLSPSNKRMTFFSLKLNQSQKLSEVKIINRPYSR